MNISEFIGMVFTDIKLSDDKETLIFKTNDNRTFEMYHEQDCCESVSLEDVSGELDWLIDSPVLKAEEVTKEGDTDWGTNTWTFYHINTAKGYVTLRWYGESNGYYSESVDIREIH